MVLDPADVPRDFIQWVDGQVYPRRLNAFEQPFANAAKRFFEEPDLLKRKTGARHLDPTEVTLGTRDTNANVELDPIGGETP
jgi:hypothetical protein